MKRFKQLFKNRTSVIAMIHVDALPGTPKNRKSIAEIVEKALKECEQYKNAGVHGIMIENMHDIPYLNSNAGYEIVSAMTRIGHEVKKFCGLPTGMQILAGANKQALAAAQAAELDFIRAEGFVFSHVADEGFIDSCAAELLRYRKNIGAENILIFTDIKKKHSSHAITSDINIAETAHAAEFFLSDGVIVTGSCTGLSADIDELRSVKNSVEIPVLVGSGVNCSNISDYAPLCDAVIIGSHFKENDYWENDVVFEKVLNFMNALNKLNQ